LICCHCSAATKSPVIETVAGRGREPVFKASALNGSGVLESFFGLLHVTWQKLDNEHQLAKMIGIDRADFLRMAAKQLGAVADVPTLLGSSVGGSLDRKSGVPT